MGLTLDRVSGGQFVNPALDRSCLDRCFFSGGFSLKIPRSHAIGLVSALLAARITTGATSAHNPFFFH
ncbi:hypothetical protein GGE07_005642 [Sinorhizobium terangae]|uniref:Uncharacterized protein n=1 Tax=Sinorhizobium terangae TaxID=110322 RepID=A0A6N7LKQ1_SINTE|nr:hypothetical protein [Sinorhizobium terangae]MBB4188963.1 hypothetical protein [Sinorhizobium terangae]MQX17788.1 hypothetical protein [Sinorhizobium terangae]